MNNTFVSSRLELLEKLPFQLQIEIAENMFRKNSTESEKAEIQKLLRPYFQKQSKQGERSDLQTTKTTIPNMLVKVEPESVNEKIAKVFGESDENVRRREIVFEKIDEDTKKELDSGKKTLNSVYQKTIARQNASRPLISLPKGKFTDIVTDHGWWFDNKNIGGSGKSGASFQYKVQPTVDIAKIPIKDIAADNAVLYEWTTNQHLITGSMLMKDFLEIAYGHTPEQTGFLGKTKVQSDALSVMYCHGFIPKYIITWEKEQKEGWGGYSFNNVTEHLLIGIRGKVPPFGLQEKTIVKSKYVPRSHSKKPEEMWNLIEKCVAKTRVTHRKLELNCRNPRKGWHPHGDEITEKDIKAWKKL